MTTTMEKTFNIFNTLVGVDGDEDFSKKPVIIQGITGSYGSAHTRLMKAYGTNIAAGVTPGKGGQVFEGVPIYNTMTEAVKATGAQISGIFVPAPFFLKAGTTVVLSRSGTLMYEVSYHLTNKDFGQRLCLGIGGDPINGTNLIEAFNLVRNRNDVESVVVVGEIGGDAEEQLAQYIILTNFAKPVIAYIAGRAAPKEKRMGHAGAIVYGNYGSAESKVANYARANVPVAKRPAEVPELLARKLKK